MNTKLPGSMISSWNFFITHDDIDNYFTTAGKSLASLNDDLKPGEFDYESDSPPTETIARCCQFPGSTNN